MKFRSQNGFSIIGAIFIIVVVALIAAFLVGIGASQRTSSAHAVVALRAHFAAMSGVEWAVHQVLANPASPACFANGTSFTVPGVGSGNFRVTAVCAEAEVTEGSDMYSVFDITVQSEVGTAGQEDYFSRTITASVATPP